MWTEMSDAAILTEIGRRIRDERMQRDMQQKDVSQFCGVGLSTVTRMEKGTVVSFDKFIKVLRALDLLENLDLLLPKKPINPILLRKLQGKRRLRVRKQI